MEKYLELLRELCNFEGNFHPSSKRLPLLTTSTAKTISMNTYFTNSPLMILWKRSKCFAFTQNNYSNIHSGFKTQFFSTSNDDHHNDGDYWWWSWWWFHNDKGWEWLTVIFPPFINPATIHRWSFRRKVTQVIKQTLPEAQRTQKLTP